MTATSLPATARVGIVGLGLMGRACATRLAAVGHTLVGHDIDPARRADFVAAGHAAVDAVAALAGCDAVVLAVFDTAQVEDVLEGADGLIAAGRAAGRWPLVVCTSTCDPDRIEALAPRCAAAGLGFVEMPISGTSASLAKGDAVGLVAGDAAAVARAAPLLAALCPQRHDLGAAGQGGRAKLAVNLVLGLHRAAMAEGLVFAERLGLDPQRFLAVLTGSAAYSRVMDVKGTMMATRAFEPPQSKVGQSLKDFELILAQATARGQGLPFAQVYAGLMKACVARGEADRDNAVIVEAVERCGADG